MGAAAAFSGGEEGDVDPGINFSGGDLGQVGSGISLGDEEFQIKRHVLTSIFISFTNNIFCKSCA